MKTVIKVSTGVLLFFASLTSMKAQIVADIRDGFGNRGSTPVPVITDNYRDRNDSHNYDSRDLRKEREELEHSCRIAAGLRERIKSDYDLGDYRAADYDKNRLHEVNERIEHLQRHIEIEERDTRRDHYENRDQYGNRDQYENRDRSDRRNGDWR